MNGAQILNKYKSLVTIENLHAQRLTFIMCQYSVWNEFNVCFFHMADSRP